MWKIPAWKAIAKCLLQGIRYTLAWTGLWWVLAALLLLPVFLRILQKKNGAFFSHPILFTGYAYGLFCSMSCPLFYTMNSTGPGRRVAIVYYMFLLISFYRILLLDRLCASENAGTTEPPGENRSLRKA